MGESTDYIIVSIVAIVGLVAIIAMMDLSPAMSLDITDSSVVGAAITLPPYSQLDMNSDGVINSQDSVVLADAIALDACPDFKTCDIDANRVLDERDLALLNNLLSEPINQESESSPATGYVTSVPARSNNIVGYSSVTTTLA